MSPRRDITEAAQASKRLKAKTKAKARKAAKRSRRAEDEEEHEGQTETHDWAVAQKGAGAVIAVSRTAAATVAAAAAAADRGGLGMVANGEPLPKHVKKRMRRQAAKEIKRAALGGVIEPAIAEPSTSAAGSAGAHQAPSRSPALHRVAEEADLRPVQKQKKKGKRSAAERLQGARFRMLNEKVRAGQRTMLMRFCQWTTCLRCRVRDREGGFGSMRHLPWNAAAL